MSSEKKQNVSFNISFTKRCILMSKIALSKNLILLNSFDFFPLVKLYIADQNQENFIYSKIKGVICFFKENENLIKKEATSTINQEEEEQKTVAKDSENSENFNNKNKDDEQKDSNNNKIEKIGDQKEDQKNKQEKTEKNNDSSNNNNDNKNEIENTKKEIIFHFQIFDINNYSLLFDLELNEQIIKDYKLLSDNLYYLCINDFCLGFKFFSADESKYFYEIISKRNEPDQNILQQNNQSLEISSNDQNDIKKTIKNIKNDLKNKFHDISVKKTSLKQNDIEKTKFFNFIPYNDLYKLLMNIEYDENNNRFNFFIYKNMNLKLIKNIIEEYAQIKNSDAEFGYPIKIIFNDYTHIFDKDSYINLLITNIISNINEIKRINIFRREHMKKDESEIEQEQQELKRANSQYYSNNSNRSSLVTNTSPSNLRNSAMLPNSVSQSKLGKNVKSNIDMRRSEANRNLKDFKDVIEELPEEDNNEGKSLDKSDGWHNIDKNDLNC